MFHVRKVLEADLPRVYAVEAATKAEISPAYMEGELYNPLCLFYLVEAEETRQISGYLLAWQIDDSDCEIHHLAVLPQWRRRGLASLLINRMVQQNNTLRRLFLEVRASNDEARRFYESLGFFRCGDRKGYYRNPLEDARLYQYNISLDK